MIGTWKKDICIYRLPDELASGAAHLKCPTGVCLYRAERDAGLQYKADAVVPPAKRLYQRILPGRRVPNLCSLHQQVCKNIVLDSSLAHCPPFYVHFIFFCLRKRKGGRFKDQWCGMGNKEKLLSSLTFAFLSCSTIPAEILMNAAARAAVGLALC